MHWKTLRLAEWSTTPRSISTLGTLKSSQFQSDLRSMQNTIRETSSGDVLELKWRDAIYARCLACRLISGMVMHTREDRCVTEPGSGKLHLIVLYRARVSSNPSQLDAHVRYVAGIKFQVILIDLDVLKRSFPFLSVTI